MSTEPVDPGTALQASRVETRAAFENRALIYAYLFDELEAEMGAERAAELMKRAIYRRGLEIGDRFKGPVAAGDLDEIGRLFAEGSPCEGALFEPATEVPAENGRTVLRMTACPLVDAWRNAGYDEDRVDLLCDIASAVDFGTFEGAGLELKFMDRQACRGSSKCLLEVRVKAL